MDINANHLKILVIEDNPGDARLITEFLAPQDLTGSIGTSSLHGSPFLLESVGGRLRNIFHGEFAVTIAERLDAGLDLLDEEPFDAVLLDLTLPDSDGLATFERLHSHTPTVPVIVLTGLENDYFGIAAAKKGAQDYLFKGDINRSLLVRSIRYAIERAWLESQILQSNLSLEERVRLRTEELETARERASRSEKLAIIGQLSGGVAHDLRTPLGAIKNAAVYLKRKYKADGSNQNYEEISEWIDLIEQEATNANAVITNLLSNGSTKELVLSKIQIGDVIHGTMDRLALGENITLSLVIDPDLPPVFGDASQLTRVFQNLANNAQDAMQHDGRLSIVAQTNEDSVEIVVTDTGSGIEPENLDKIFEPLFTAKHNGTGLGLAICQEIISQHNGSISVHSETGSGTSFTILIPLVPEIPEGAP